MKANQLFNLVSKRSFSASVFNYSSAANPRVYLTVAQNDQRIGDLVFELYAERQPQTTDSFQALCEGSEGNSYVGSGFHQG